MGNCMSKNKKEAAEDNTEQALETRDWNFGYSGLLMEWTYYFESLIEIESFGCNEMLYPGEDVIPYLIEPATDWNFGFSGLLIEWTYYFERLRLIESFDGNEMFYPGVDVIPYLREPALQTRDWSFGFTTSIYLIEWTHKFESLIQIWMQYQEEDVILYLILDLADDPMTPLYTSEMIQNHDELE